MLPRKRPTIPPEHPRESSAERYLKTEHLSGDLAARSVGGAMVTLLAQGAKVALQVGSVVLLARLLTPADFGVFAVIAVFLSVLELLKDMGLSTVTVQRPSLNERQISTLFWLNVGLGVMVGAIFAALGPFLARLYGQPVLGDIVPVVAICFLFTGLAAQHLALLRRQMQFGTAALIQVGAEMLGMLAAVGAALGGAGLWSLVVQRLVWAAATAAGAWLACGWHPGRPGPIRDVREMIAFGGNATAAMIVSQLAASLDKALIGWWSGIAAAGLFERSQKLVFLPIQNFNSPLAAVAVPALSRLAGQPGRYRRAYVSAVERLSMLIAPIGGLLIVASDRIVLLVLGPQWSEAAPILAWMGVAALYMPVTYTLSWLYMTQDRTAEMLRAGFVNAAMTLAALAVGLPFGPIGVAATFALSGIALRVPVLCWLASRRGPVGPAALARIFVLPLVAASAVGLAVHSLRSWNGFEGLGALAAVGLVFVVAGAVAAGVYIAFPHGRTVLRDTARMPSLLMRRRVSA
jgi:PST family polysaccharide transporter